MGQATFELGQGRANRTLGRAAWNALGSQRSLDRKAVGKVAIERRRDFAQFFERQFGPWFLLAFGFFENLADRVMRLAEGHAFANQIVGGFRGQQSGVRSGGTETVVAIAGYLDGARCDREHVRDLIVRGKERFFVLLQIALIAGGKTFERCEQGNQGAGDAA